MQLNDGLVYVQGCIAVTYSLSDTVRNVVVAVVGKAFIAGVWNTNSRSTTLTCLPEDLIEQRIMNLESSVHGSAYIGESIDESIRTCFDTD